MTHEDDLLAEVAKAAVKGNRLSVFLAENHAVYAPIFRAPLVNWNDAAKTLQARGYGPGTGQALRQAWYRLEAKKRREAKEARGAGTRPAPAPGPATAPPTARAGFGVARPRTGP